MNSFKAIVFIGALGTWGVSSATVIDFEDLATPSGGYANVADGYTSQGYQFTSSYSGGFAVWAADSGYYAGSTALFNNYGGETTTLSKVGGGAFDLNAMDLANVYRSSDVQSIIFTGTFADASTVTESVTLTDGANLNQFAFSNFTGVVSVS
jgi:hypothetical protein